MSAAALKQAPAKTAAGRAVTAAGRPRAALQTKTSPEPRIIRRSVAAAAGATRPASRRPAHSSPADAARRRRVVVFGGLVGVLTVTSALLLAMQPAPLAPDAVKSLMSINTPAEIDALFATQVPLRESHWRYIYVHHRGASASGGVSTQEGGHGAPDHFVIGNGDGAGDGEVRIGQRWNGQQPAGSVTGVTHMSSDVISISLAGDLDRASPTPRQMEQLSRLVTSLQNKLQIGRDRVQVIDASGLPAGAGRYFPRDAFRGSLLP